MKIRRTRLRTAALLAAVPLCLSTITVVNNRERGGASSYTLEVTIR
jgi:hypothetical protein